MLHKSFHKLVMKGQSNIEAYFIEEVERIQPLAILAFKYKGKDVTFST